MNEYIETINSQLKNDFERELFEAVQANLNDTDNVLRLSNFAYSARELISNVLHRLAPTEGVLKCPWYKDMTPIKNKPTRAQRIFYAMHGGLETEYIEEKLGVPLQHTKKCIVEQIEALSKYTHITEKTFKIDDKEDVVALEAFSSLANFFEILNECRAKVATKLSEEIVDKEVVDAMLFETDMALDELASHHSIEYIDTHEVTIESISHDTIYINAYGTVSVGLQWGSSSDNRNGEGATLDQSFPLVAALVTPIENYDEIEVINVGADTSEWWANYYDDEE